MLQLEESQYNSDDVSLPFVNESQWAQYQLDRFETTEQVVRNVGTLRVVSGFTGIHYFITDASGESATVEFLDGKPVVHFRDTLPIAALTNDPYDYTLKFYQLSGHQPFVGPAFRTSARRFGIAAETLKKTQEMTADALPRLADLLLDRVRLNGTVSDALFEPTQWRVLYDVGGRNVRFQTRSSVESKTLDLTAVDFSPGQATLVLDMNRAQAGDVRLQLEPYTDVFNRQLVEKNSWLMGRKKCEQAIQYGMEE